MTVPVVFAISGVIALLLGILGGGIKAKEITVPSLSPTIRFFSIVIGMGLISASLWISNPNIDVSNTPTLPALSTQVLTVNTNPPVTTPTVSTIQEVTPNLPSDSFTEDFSKGSQYWALGTKESEYSTRSLSIVNNILRWQVVAKQDINVVMGYPKLPVVSNFDMEATLKFVNGSDTVEYGFLFRRTDAGSYRFEISNGSFSLQKYSAQDNTTINLLDWTTPSKPMDLYGENKLRVYAKGNIIRVYINDLLVGDVIDNSFTTGVVDIIAFFLEGEKLTLDVSSFKLTLLTP